MEQNLIEIKDLFKEFKQQKALWKVTMNIPRNCVYGLLGPNGA